MSMKKVVKTGESCSFEDDMPNYGKNYSKGYIGFTYDKNSKISELIVNRTNFCNYSGIKVSHVLIVEDDNYCIEALMGKETGKVLRSPLSKYFDDPDRYIFFRKPKETNAEILNQIAQTAVSKVGLPYETKEILGQAICTLPLIRHFNKATRNFFIDIAAKIIDNPNAFICSELAAYCLKSPQNWEYHNKGILKRSTCRVNPQELFEDKTIFKEWKIT